MKAFITATLAFLAASVVLLPQSRTFVPVTSQMLLNPSPNDWPHPVLHREHLQPSSPLAPWLLGGTHSPPPALPRCLVTVTISVRGISKLTEHACNLAREGK